MDKTIRIGLILLLGLFLQACMDVASTGAQAIYHRQALNNSLQDYSITVHAYKALQDRRFDDARIVVATLNKEVLLAGQVPSLWQKKKVEEIIRNLGTVDYIYNRLQISAPSSVLTQISDAWITAKVKTQLIASNEIDATQIKVVTENGTVYLMGLVRPENGEEISNIVQNTEGVGRVEKIFSYVYVKRAV